MRISIEQRFGREDLAVLAEAALRHLLVNPGALQRMEYSVAREPFERRDVRSLRSGNGPGARSHRFAFDDHRACPALPEAASEARPLEAKIVAQHVEERNGRLDIHQMRRAVHGQGNPAHRFGSPRNYTTVSLAPTSEEINISCSESCASRPDVDRLRPSLRSVHAVAADVVGVRPFSVTGESLMRKRFALAAVLCLSLAGLFVGLSANDQRDQQSSQRAGKRLGGKMSAAGQAARRRSRNVGLETPALGRIQELLGTKSPGKAQCAEADDGECGEGEGLTDGPPSTQSEVSIAVDSTGQHVVVGFNDFRGFDNGTNPLSVSGFMYSDDGGATFVDGGQLPSPGTDAIGTQRFPQVFGDPDVRYLGACNFIYSSIILTKFSPTTAAETMGVHRSTDCGHTWTGPFEVTAATNPNGFIDRFGSPVDAADKEFMSVDSDTGRVLMSWSNFTNPAVVPSAPGGVEISTTYSDNVMTATPPTWSARRVVGHDEQDGQSPRRRSRTVVSMGGGRRHDRARERVLLRPGRRRERRCHGGVVAVLERRRSVVEQADGADGARVPRGTRERHGSAEPGRLQPGGCEAEPTLRRLRVDPSGRLRRWATRPAVHRARRLVHSESAAEDLAASGTDHRHRSTLRPAQGQA